jgi:two-component system, chemotaxis family, CheB/CheR fusion protein
VDADRPRRSRENEFDCGTVSLRQPSRTNASAPQTHFVPSVANYVCRALLLRLGYKQTKITKEKPVSSTETFPVVGIGSSAGGVEALQLLFKNMPPDSGMAFILVSHLARDYQSLLPEIVARHARMPVMTASDGERVEPNSVYVCPPNHLLRVAKHTLQLTQLVSDHPHKPIDVFLSSLAEDYAEAAVGILLSGAGSDGALGMKAIKESGGLTVAQGSGGKGPLHREMPDAAIASGMVDIVAPVEQIPAKLVEYAHSFGVIGKQRRRTARKPHRGGSGRAV